MTKKIKASKKKLKKQKEEQKEKRMKIVNWIIMSVLIISVLVLLSAMIYHLINPPQKVRGDVSSLGWTYEEIIKSPEKSVVFVKTVIGEVKNLTPENYVFIKGDYYEENAKLYFDSLLRSDFFSKSQRLIKRAKNVVKKNNPAFSVIIIPDLHSSPMLEPKFSWTKDGLNRQKQIKEYIKEKNIPYVFVESHSGELNHKNMYENYLQVAKSGRVPKKTFEEFKFWNKQTARYYWYGDLIEELVSPRVVGADDENLIFLMTLINHLQLNTPFLKNFKMRSFKGIANAINFTLRDQILLSKIILFSHEKQIKQAVFVVGRSHMVTLPKHCEIWGIKCAIEAIDPNFVAPQLERLKEFEQKHGKKWPGQ